MKITFFILLLFMLFQVACSSHGLKNKNINLPDNSIASDRDALAIDMISGVSQFIERNLACTDWSLSNILENKAEGQLVFTSDGQIYRGSFLEKWELLVCGDKLILTLEITHASQGGSVIRIKM